MDRFGIMSPFPGIENFTNTLRGQYVAVIAPGPTLRELQSLAEFDVAIFVGDAHLRTAMRARRNIYVRANTEFPRLDSETDLEPLISDNFEFVLASSVMESSTPVSLLAEQSLRGRSVTLFDQRHFEREDCTPIRQCCESKLGVTIQEHLAKFVGWTHHYSQGATVLVHAIALALIGKSGRVDIFGAGIPLKQRDYVYAGIDGNQPKLIQGFRLPSLKVVRAAIGNPRWLKFYFARMLLGEDSPSILAEDIVELIADFQYLADCAAHIGTRLISRSSVSNLSRVAGYNHS